MKTLVELEKQTWSLPTSLDELDLLVKKTFGSLSGNQEVERAEVYSI